MSFKSLIKQKIISAFPGLVQYKPAQIPADANISYSQEGEDMILERFLSKKKSGFFVDVGAHHPTRFSNTYHFYLKGWRGINVDATPGSMEAFNKLRPEDINIEVGIADKEGQLTYYLFNEPALNTFSKERADMLLAETSYQLEKTISVKTKTLSRILDEYLPANQNIDFLTIDVEGLDFDILLTNNWERYKPSFILVEDLGGSLDNLANSKLNNYLVALGYRAVAKTHNTLFFRLVQE